MPQPRPGATKINKLINLKKEEDLLSSIIKSVGKIKKKTRYKYNSDKIKIVLQKKPPN